MRSEVDWPVVRLDDIAADITVGHVGPMATEYVPVGVPFLRSQNVQPFRVSLDDVKYVGKDFHARLAKSALRPGDVVIVRTGRPGSAAVIPPDLPVANCADLVIVRPGPRLDSHFLMYFINSAGSGHVASHLVGAVQQHFNVGSARALCIPLPPLPEQRRIARSLGALDDKIELNRRMNRTLESLARAIFTAWFVDLDPVRRTMKGKLGGDLGLSQDRWPAVPFSETVEILSGGTPATGEVSYWGGSIPWYSVADAPSPGDVFVTQTEKTVTSEGIENSAAQVVPELTTIISARGTVGRCALTGRDMAFNQSCFGLMPADHAGYYFTYFSTLRIVAELQQSAHGSVFSTITRPTFASVHVPKPSARLVAAFDAKVQPLMTRVRSNVDESRTLQMARDSLLTRLISGEFADGVPPSRGANGEGS